MIPQPFVKGSGERVFFGYYEYPPGADIIFDFGNPICTSQFNSNRIVFNVGSANVTGSLISFNNPTPNFPTLSSQQGGVMITDYVSGIGSSHMRFDSTSTLEQTNISLFALNGAQQFPYQSFVPAAAQTGSNSIQVEVFGTATQPNDAGYRVTNITGDYFMNVGVANGRNGYNMISAQTNASTIHNLYLNESLVATNPDDIPRASNATLGIRLGFNAEMKIMAFLQYPRILAPKEIRQLVKVFSQRYFL
jgi:hypothetical protein